MSVQSMLSPQRDYLHTKSIPLMTLSGTRDLIGGIENILLGVSGFGEKSYTLVDERKS